jgi:hypothetical protein
MAEVAGSSGEIMKYSDRWNYNLIPNHMMEAIHRYADQHLPVGDFLEAIICNDLNAAVGKADDDNYWIIQIYVSYFYNEIPGPAWGSKQAYKAWLEMREKEEAE